MPSWTAEAAQEFDEGVYRAKLIDLEEAEGGIDDKGYIKWIFELLDEEYEDQTLRANSSKNFGPSAKARAWAEALLGRRIETGETVGNNELIGLKGDLMIRNKETDSGTFARVESVNPVRKKAKKKDEPKQEEEFENGQMDNPDSEDLPPF